MTCGNELSFVFPCAGINTNPCVPLFSLPAMAVCPLGLSLPGTEQTLNTHPSNELWKLLYHDWGKFISGRRPVCLFQDPTGKPGKCILYSSNFQMGLSWVGMCRHVNPSKPSVNRFLPLKTGQLSQLSLSRDRAPRRPETHPNVGTQCTGGVEWIFRLWNADGSLPWQRL